MRKSQQSFLVRDVVHPEPGRDPEGEDPRRWRVDDQLVEVGGHGQDVILTDEPGAEQLLGDALCSVLLGLVFKSRNREEL